MGHVGSVGHGDLRIIVYYACIPLFIYMSFFMIEVFLLYKPARAFCNTFKRYRVGLFVHRHRPAMAW